MSLARAFTTRRQRSSNELGSDGGNVPRRSNTTAKGPILRHKISAPVQLIHTTNMLSYNAPDLPRPSRSSSTKTKSDEESDAATVDSTPPTSPDVAPGERCSSPEPNHLTSYFRAPAKTMDARGAATPPPAIPKRSPSHTKKNSYDAIARSRSVSRMSRDSEQSTSTKTGQTFSRPPSTSTRASSASHTSTPQSAQKQQAVASPPPAATPTTSFQQLMAKDQHPFGQELAQVTELAEEYSAGSNLDTIDEEQQYLDSRGLIKLSADDYLGAIQSLTSTFFPELRHAKPPAPLWI
ncbi:NAD-dependent histone deacetylase SIR2 [Purpureocillium lavendulum]|uniref:NAD-dependent histone deacetylase SIR2 n=1 Tax=Purpureocillium lavendulum TaxID=1247861 RepID=A0AB34G4N2_9HYPO|nr:NAD-dependent histone deacetylase SIR2 [Purpureocillium lavendulum]